MTMDPGRWRLVEQLFHAALELEPACRAAFLAEECGSDAALRREVETLVDAHDADAAFLEVPIVAPGGLDPARAVAPETPRMIGPYEVVRPLGEGGMGEVFLARQHAAEFTRFVAIKVVKRGMDTAEVLRRFALERRILASLVHPNIAQLHEAGATAEGRPYFVMELVEGERIDRWITRRAVELPQRLRLFQAVCAAVHHAHQNLIVHRDIKPGNVIVSADGTPKLVDFGIGKLLSEEGGAQTATRTRARALTPDYAAPEQLRGEPVTTGVDVYGLGALLYELLTGRRPYIEVTGSDAERAETIVRTAPPRPSDVVARDASLSARERARRARRLRGDLDTIVARAMHREANRRYGSVAALSEDVGRHLSGHPILARPDSVGYRVGKFVRRNAWSVSTAAAVVVGLLAVTLTAMVESRRVLHERDKAQEVQSFLLETFGASAAEGERGDSVTVRQLLDAQVATLRTAYANEPELRAEMLDVLADAYERLGLYDRAEEIARRALGEGRALARGADDEGVAASLGLLGWIRHRQGASNEAAVLLERSVEMGRRLGASGREGLARALNDLGSVYDQLGRADEAEPLLRESLAIRRTLSGSQDRAVAVTASNLAVLLYRRGDYAAADSLGSLALDRLRATVGVDHQRTVIAQGNLAAFRLQAGDLEGAAELQGDLLSRQTRIQGREHPVTASVMVAYANVLIAQGRTDRALELLREALDVQTRLLDPDHRDIANTVRLLGAALIRAGRPDEALPYLERAVAMNRRAYGDEHAQVAESLLGVAVAQERAGHLEAALESYRSTAETFTAALGADHPRSIDALIRLGAVLLLRDRAAEALDAFRRAHRLAVGREAPEPALVDGSRLRMAEAELALGRPDLADSLVSVTERALTSEVPSSVSSRLGDLRAALDSLDRGGAR